MISGFTQLGPRWSTAEAGDGAATGIEIPKGDPSDLRRAATTWAHTGDLLARQGRAINRAALTAALAGWSGTASMSFMTATQKMDAKLNRAAAACRRGAVACRQFAAALHHAQNEARRAIAEAKDAMQRIDTAKRKIATASAAAAAAETEVVAAQTLAQSARGVAGPLGELGAQEAKRRETLARGEAMVARSGQRRGEALLDDAEADLRRARRRGEEANQDARDAARKAAAALADVAAAANVPPMAFALPAPGLRDGRPPGPLSNALAALRSALKDGKVTIAGTTVELEPSALDWVGAGNDAVIAHLAILRRTAEQERRRALTALSRWRASHPLMRNAKISPTRLKALKAMREREINKAARPGTVGKWAGRGSRLLKKMLPPLTAYENHKKKMPLVENGLRTGLSTSFGGVGATAGAACGPAAVVCSPALGFAGAKVGDLTGGLLYDGLDLRYQKIIKPLAGEVSEAVGDGIDTAGDLLGIGR